MNFKAKYDGYKEEFEKELENVLQSLNCKPDILSESMIYSLKLGGKRIRPVLMFAVGDLLQIERRKLYKFAVALEFIHTYSLIHDDLPEMDNDDFRRGKPSNHKVFGAGNAILAGNGLLNTAYSILFNECFKGEEYISASKYICDCAGIFGMLAGQSADLLHENDKNVENSILDFIYENKTSKLLSAAVVTPSILCKGKYFAELTVFSKELGLLFQYVDDILDVEGNFETTGKSVGKDSVEGKYTSVKLFGLEGCKLKADVLADKLDKILEGFSGETEFIKELVYFIRQRTN